MVDSDVSTSIWTLEVFSGVLTCALVVHWEVGDGGNFQNQLFFWRDLFRLNSQRVLGADDVEFGRFCWTESWISSTIGASWATRFGEVGVSAAADLNHIVVLVLSKGILR